MVMLYNVYAQLGTSALRQDLRQARKGPIVPTLNAAILNNLWLIGALFGAFGFFLFMWAINRPRRHILGFTRVGLWMIVCGCAAMAGGYYAILAPGDDPGPI